MKVDKFCISNDKQLICTKKEGKKDTVYTCMYKLARKLSHMNHGTDSLYQAVHGMIVFDILYMFGKIE